MSRLLRSPDILVGWDGRSLFVKDLAGQRTIVSTPEIVAILDLFGRPRTPGTAADLLPEYERPSVLRSIRRLASIGLLLPEKEGRRRVSRLRAWRQNLASAQYHVACRDPRYLVRPGEIDRYLRQRVVTRSRPPRFKRYPAAPRVGLPERWAGSAAASHLEDILRARRTTREFARRPVLLENLAALLRGTWGKTGELESETLGKLTTKTSPSAGALHPIECYVLAWNVRGL
ncbi:MAG TPA: nitroreductase family protein, partial [Thermoanaerobaculia bacterium]